MLPLVLSAEMSANDAAIQKKYESGITALIIWNEEMEDTMKIVKLLEEFKLLVKWISEIINNETKGKKGWFLPMLLGTLGASLLRSALTEKWVIRAGEGTIRSVKEF